MRRVTAMAGVAAFVLWATASTFAQAPNFSGTWVRDAAAAGAAAGAGGGGGGAGQRGGGGGGGGVFACGAECTIVQDAKTLTIKRPPNQQGTAQPDIVINLVGVTKLTQQGRGGAAPTEYEAKASVEGSKWIVTRAVTMGETSFTSTQTVSLEAGKLTVVTTTTREGATPQTQTYSKK